MLGYVDPQLELRASLAGKWLLLVGDSSLRMTYHLLIGHFRRKWKQWPRELDNHARTTPTGPGPSYLSANNSCELTRKQANEKPGATKCLEHILINGTQISFLWVDKLDVDQLHPLREFARTVADGTPDGIAVTMGAWHAYELENHRPLRSHILREYEVRLTALLHELQELFPSAPRVVAGLPKCGNSSQRKQSESEIGSILHNASTLLGWDYFDRAAVTAHPCSVCPCSVLSDCQLGSHHPRGATLNILTKLLLLHLGFTVERTKKGKVR